MIGIVMPFRERRKGPETTSSITPPIGSSSSVTGVGVSATSNVCSVRPGAAVMLTHEEHCYPLLRPGEAVAYIGDAAARGVSRRLICLGALPEGLRTAHFASRSEAGRRRRTYATASPGRDSPASRTGLSRFVRGDRCRPLRRAFALQPHPSSPVDHHGGAPFSSKDGMN